jgi:nucleotide-binding universal stress UspA family protein
MPWTAKELEARAPVLAAALVALLENERLAARFIDSYAEEAKRAGLKAHAERYRELLATIGRESLLAMAAEIDRVVVRSLARRSGRVSRRATQPLAETFRRALVASLAEKLSWAPEEREAFGRDLGLYLRLDPRGGEGRVGRARPPEGPFVDRSALLLDPPMLAQARRAAAAYLAELEAHGERAFRRAFRRRQEKRTGGRGTR